MKIGHRLLLLTLLLPAGLAGQQDPGIPPALGTDASRVRLGEPAGTPLTGTELDRMTEELASLMRCPVCQGLSIADSPVPLAAAMKKEVRDLLAAGYERQQVLDYFEGSYGEFIRLAPRARGFNLTVWVAPALALLAGLALILWRGRGGARQQQRARPADEDPELDSYRERVRREVAS